MADSRLSDPIHLAIVLSSYSSSTWRSIHQAHYPVKTARCKLVERRGLEPRLFLRAKEVPSH
jgi:hypothetical protein